MEARKKKKFLKPYSVLKYVCQAFGLLVDKRVKFTEAFKYEITSVLLTVATSKHTLYQPDKAGLRNYIINLPKSSSHEYPRDVKWVVDGQVTICSVPPSANYEDWFKTLATFIAPPAEA